MDKVFKYQIKRNMEVYVDDMVVKSNKPDSYAQDLEELFAQIWKHSMQLNPKKCVLGVRRRNS